MKTVLSFIDWYLPGYRAGGTLKAFANQVAHLDKEYYFKIITRDTDYCETEPYAAVKSNQWNKVAENAEVFYASADFINTKNFKALVQSTDFDAVYIHGIYSFWFSILPIWLCKKVKASPIVVVTHGMFGKHSIAVKSAKKKIFVAASKMLGLYKGVIFHAANQSEANDVKNVLGKNVKIIIAEELPMKMKMKDWTPRNKKIGELNLLSVARISPEKNTKFAIQALQQIHNVKIVYDIYGPVYDEEYWKECETEIKKLPNNVEVNYKGSIPGSEVLDAMKKYHLMFLPTTGENFGHTILESFMSSTPVLISDKTPWLELSKKGIGWSLPLADPNAFAQVLSELAQMDQDAYDLLSQNALDFAWDFVNDETLIDQNIKLFKDE